MKYYVANFQIKDAPSIGDCRDLLATMASEAGFESFEETDEGLNGYVQQSMLDESKLRELLGDFPIEGVKITYTLSQVEDKDWNEQWENEGFEPIVVGDRCVIHDTKHQADAVLTGGKDLLDITIGRICLTSPSRQSRLSVPARTRPPVSSWANCCRWT